MIYSSVVMTVVALVFEQGGFAELFRSLGDISNNVLWTLLAGCVMTALNKTTSIFL